MDIVPREPLRSVDLRVLLLDSLLLLHLRQASICDVFAICALDLQSDLSLLVSFFATSL